MCFVSGIWLLIASGVAIAIWYMCTRDREVAITIHKEPGSPTEEIEALAGKLGLTVESTFLGLTEFYTVVAPSERVGRNLVAALLKLPYVITAYTRPLR